MIKYSCLVLLILSATGYYGCSPAGKTTVAHEPTVTSRTVSDHYTSAFPSRDVTDEISEIFQSIKRITSTGTYQIYYFEDSLVTVEQINRRGPQNLATRSITKNESTAGTAITIARDRSKTVLLTCAHVIHFPDTLLEFVDNDRVPDETYVHSIALKNSQRNLVFDLPNLAEFGIVDMDRDKDLALISFSRFSEPDMDAPPLTVRLGRSEKLAWGSFIYHAGYPKGVPLITRGIVSNPGRNPRGDYMTDVLFNPGASGGILLASRDHYESFEWVGVANSVTVSTEWLLVPDPYHYKPDKVEQPYTGTPFIEKKTRIAYGVTQAIPTSIIFDFLRRNRSLLGNMSNNLQIFD